MEAQPITLALAFLRKRPESAASTLEQQDVKDVVGFLESIPASYASSVLKCMIPHFGARVCKNLGIERAAALLVSLEIAQIANILRYIDKQRREELLEFMPRKSKRACNLLLSYSKNTVGAWVSPHAEVIPRDYDAQEAIDYLKNVGSKGESGYIYVVDRENEFIGRIHYSDIIRADPEQKIGPLVETNSSTLKARAQILHVNENDAWAVADTLPVVNQKGRFLGLLRHLDLRKAIAFLSTQNAKPSIDPMLDNNLAAYGDVLVSCFQAMGEIAETDARI